MEDKENKLNGHDLGDHPEYCISKTDQISSSVIANHQSVQSSIKIKEEKEDSDENSGPLTLRYTSQEEGAVAFEAEIKSCIGQFSGEISGTAKLQPNQEDSKLFSARNDPFANDKDKSDLLRGKQNTESDHVQSSSHSVDISGNELESPGKLHMPYVENQTFVKKDTINSISSQENKKVLQFQSSVEGKREKLEDTKFQPLDESEREKPMNTKFQPSGESKKEKPKDTKFHPSGKRENPEDTKFQSLDENEREMPEDTKFQSLDESEKEKPKDTKFQPSGERENPEDTKFQSLDENERETPEDTKFQLLDESEREKSEDTKFQPLDESEKPENTKFQPSELENLKHSSDMKHLPSQFDKTGNSCYLGMNKTCAVNQLSPESLCETDYLDSVISSIQSVNKHHSEAKRDIVQISRAELTLMVEQTLAAQTMCNYLQDLGQKNKQLNKQNEILKETIMELHLRQSQSLPADSEEQVFRFDKCLLFPFSSSSGLDQSSRTVGYCCSRPYRISGIHDANEENVDVQVDGDSNSFQLPSQLNFDGDPSLDNTEGKEYSAAGGTSFQQNIAAYGASVSMADKLPMNIPNQVLFEEAQYLKETQQYEENLIGSAGISPEQHELATDELEKIKLFVHKICTAGGIHPNNLNELVNLREKVGKLQDENAALRSEIQNQPFACVIPGSTGDIACPMKKLQAANIDLLEKIQKQKERETFLHQLIAKLGEEKKELKRDQQSIVRTRPQSQQPSSVGLHALPTIPSTAEVDCQASVNSQDSGTQTDPVQAELSYQLHQANVIQLRNVYAQLVSAKEQLAKANQNDIESRETLETLRVMHSAKTEEVDQLRHQIAEKTVLHAKFMAVQTREIDRLKKTNSQETERCKQLEEMIKDERRRWARDEKQLLEQVRKDAKDIHNLERLVVAVDHASRTGQLLNRDSVEHVAALRRQLASNIPLSTPSHSVRSVTSRTSTNLNLTHSHLSPSGQDNNSAIRPAPGNSNTLNNQVSHGGFSGSTGHLVIPNNHSQRSTVAEYSSLPPELSGKHSQQPSGKPGQS